MKLSLCWRCENAVPSAEHGCSWSRSFKPVEGWNAVKREMTVKSNVTKKGRVVDTYHVRECPMFKEDCKVGELSTHEHDKCNDFAIGNYETRVLTNLSTGQKFETGADAAKWIIANHHAKGEVRNVREVLYSYARKRNRFDAYGFSWKAEYVKKARKSPNRKRLRCNDTGVVYESILEAAKWISTQKLRSPATIQAYIWKMLKIGGPFKVYGISFEEVSNEG